MHPTETEWAAILRAFPDGEELAAAVAAELDEEIDEVRPTVLVGTVARRERPGSSEEIAAAIEAERARVRTTEVPLPAARILTATTQVELLAETERMEASGALDLASIVTIQRTSGAIAARSDQRLVLFLARYGVIRRIAWERVVDEMQAGRLDPEAGTELAGYILLWNELTSLAVTDGYRAAERDIVARDAEARRGALQELLGVVSTEAATTARLRRVAIRHGLDPDGTYRLVSIAPRPEADPTPERPGIGDEDLEILAGRVGHLLGSAPPGAEGLGAGIRLPATLPLHGRIAVLATADWTGLARVPTVLDSVLGGLAAAAAAPASAGKNRSLAPTAMPQAWVAVGSEAIDGVIGLAAAYSDLVDATRTAQRLGARGWIPDPEALAVERLLLTDRDLADAAVRRELGPLLADERMGAELVATLQAYFDAGESIAEAARRLHLATRTVSYRMDRVVALLGHPLDGEVRRRLSVALLIYRLRSIV